MRRARLKARQFYPRDMKLGQTSAGFALDVPVVSVVQEPAGNWIVTVEAYVTPCEAVTLAENYTYSYTASGTRRAAEDGECEIKLWNAPSSADYSAWTYDGTPGPRYDNGGWNVVPRQPTLTKGGLVKLGDPNWSDFAGVPGVEMNLSEGWYRITERHLPSGYEVAVRFQIYAGSVINASPQVLSDTGEPLTDFEQPRGQMRQPGAQIPYRIPRIAWTPAGWRYSA